MEREEGEWRERESEEREEGVGVKLREEEYGEENTLIVIGILRVSVRRACIFSTMTPKCDVDEEPLPSNRSLI